MKFRILSSIFQKLGFEFSDAPTATIPMRKAIEHLQLDKLFVIYPGGKRYQLSDKITILPVHEIPLSYDIA